MMDLSVGITRKIVRHIYLLYYDTPDQGVVVSLLILGGTMGRVLLLVVERDGTRTSVIGRGTFDVSSEFQGVSNRLKYYLASVVLTKDLRFRGPAQKPTGPKPTSGEPCLALAFLSSATHCDLGCCFLLDDR